MAAAVPGAGCHDYHHDHPGLAGASSCTTSTSPQATTRGNTPRHWQAHLFCFTYNTQYNTHEYPGYSLLDAGTRVLPAGPAPVIIPTFNRNVRSSAGNALREPNSVPGYTQAYLESGTRGFTPVPRVPGYPPSEAVIPLEVCLRTSVATTATVPVALVIIMILARPRNKK
eukprot:133365-Rhodomonas_salina.1